MAERFPRRLTRMVEARETFPLIALAAIRQLRSYLGEVEAEAIVRARQLGASVDDIADALGITRQGAHYKLKRLGHVRRHDDRRVDDVTVTLREPEGSSLKPD